jgi:hypothetical protein
MFKTALFALVALMGVLLVASPATVEASAARAGGVRLRADLTGNTRASGKADYREFLDASGNTVRRINVEVEDAPAGTIWGVKLNGVNFGQIKVDAFGNGKFSRQSATDDPNKAGFVPDMKAGDRITVGPGTVTGVLKNV